MEYCSNLLATEREIIEHGTSVEEISETLTLPNPRYQNIVRFGKGRFYSKVDPTICYLRKEGDRYVLPRYYFGQPKSTDGLVMGRRTSFNHRITLRDYQKKFFDDNPAMYDSSGVLIEMPCGHGKTVCAIYRTARLQVQTLVLVPTYYLARQWENVIRGTTDASTVVLTSNATEMPFNADFTIVVLDLFTVRVLPEELMNNIGQVILDEAHRIGADTYMPILDEIPAYYRTALTATFRRTDGAHKVLAYHFGDRFRMEYQFRKPYVYALDTGVEVRGVTSKNRPHSTILKYLEQHDYPYTETASAISFDPKQCKSVTDEYMAGHWNKTEYRELMKTLERAQDMSYTTLESYLSENCARRKIAIRAIQEALDKGRTVLFLSKRKEVLKALYEYFYDYGPMLVISETNRFTEDETRYLENECPLVFGVTQLAKEGLDIPRLDTLIIHLPLKDTEQAIGRISREFSGKKPPVALYLLDKCPYTYGVFRAAQKTIAINAEYRGATTIPELKKLL